MKQALVFFVGLLFVSNACNNLSHKQNITDKAEEINLTSSAYITKSGKVFIVSIDYANGAGICDVSIKTSGFSADNTTHNFGTIDKVEKVFLADLDSNGFEEIYIITRSAGSGSYSGIYGIASNKDKSATPIYVQPISEKQMEKGEPFDGFMGHNQFVFKDNFLINTFPVYLDGDTNTKPSGGKRTLQYQLVAGEAGWILQPSGVIEP